MSETLNICSPCGLCCDGTLIGFVQLDREELPGLRELLELEEAHEKGFFLHPCSKFCGGCTIYSQRPKQCAKFKCALLKSVEQKELDFNAAVDIINEVKQKKSALEKKLSTLQFELRDQSFHFKMIALHKVFKQKESEKLSLLRDNLNSIKDNPFRLKFYYRYFEYKRLHSY